MYRELSLDEFRFNTGIRNSHLPAEGTIISLRELARIAKVEVMMSMEEKYLKQMLRSVVLKGNHRHRLYEAAEIKVEAVPPFAFPVIQVFIQRSKYQDFLEKFSLVFQGFYSHGFSQQLPVVVIGQDEEGQTLIAHYLPPIVEECAGLAFAGRYPSLFSGRLGGNNYRSDCDQGGNCSASGQAPPMV